MLQTNLVCPFSPRAVTYKPTTLYIGITHSGKAYGLHSAKDLNSALKEDNILYIASCMKLLTSIAAIVAVTINGFRRFNDSVPPPVLDHGKIEKNAPEGAFSSFRTVSSRF